VARYDKYDPKDGGFRAPLAANLNATSKTGAGNPVGVGLDAQGRVVVGAGNTGIVGALVTTKNMVAGEIVDVMKDGEIVEMAAPAVAGSVISVVDATGRSWPVLRLPVRPASATPSRQPASSSASAGKEA